MNDNLWHQLNAVLGSLTVTVGLWLLIGALPVPIGLAVGIGPCDSAGLEMSIHWLYLGYQHIAVGSGKYGLAHDADGRPAKIGA